MGICGGVGVAHTPTYTGPPLAVDLFSVDSLLKQVNSRPQPVSDPSPQYVLRMPQSPPL